MGLEDKSKFTTSPEDVKPEGVGRLEKPAFWAVLPASVRYDEALTPSAKILYAEISSLTGDAGYCYARNAYFEELYGLTARTISRLLRDLAERGYIRIEDGTGGKETRKIYAGLNPLYAPLDKNVYPPRQKCLGGPDKNVGGNDNNKINKKKTNPPKAPQGAAWEPELFERFWLAYPRHEDKAGARREWDKLKPDRKLMKVMSAALSRAKTSDEWLRGVGIPYACRWLRNRRWEDQLEQEGGEDLPADRSLPGEQW